MKVLILWAVIILNVSFQAMAAEEILNTKTDWNGSDIVYPKGDAQVTSVILRLAPGKATPFHCHPIPTLGYILKGEVEVETKSGKTIRLKKGDAAVEVMRTLHRGVAIGGPVEILVFYAGAEGIPTTVLPDTEAAKVHCDG